MRRSRSTTLRPAMSPVRSCRPTTSCIPPTPDPSSTSGCEPSDFTPASATAPQVALIQRGTCFFEDKAKNAEAAGYDAAIIFNEGQPGRDELF